MLVTDKKLFEINPFRRILKTMYSTKIDSKWQRVQKLQSYVVSKNSPVSLGPPCIYGELCYHVVDVVDTEQELESFNLHNYEADVMDNTSDVQRSYGPPCRGAHAVEWLASAATSSMSTVWTSLIFVLLSDVVLVVTATEPDQPAPRRLPGMFL